MKQWLRHAADIDLKPSEKSLKTLKIGSELNKIRYVFFLRRNLILIIRIISRVLLYL